MEDGIVEAQEPPVLCKMHGRWVYGKKRGRGFPVARKKKNSLKSLKSLNTKTKEEDRPKRVGNDQIETRKIEIKKRKKEKKKFENYLFLTLSLIRSQSTVTLSLSPPPVPSIL